jgi:hypothetical protein
MSPRPIGSSIAPPRRAWQPRRRAADLKKQAGGSIAGPVEMAFTHALAVDVMASIPG